ncbi:MAG: TIR domain-containing protein [Planctomycetota bacterium]
MQYDIFICHASEDKKDFVKLLANALLKQNLKVWYDEFELKLGDSLREKIDYGLANSSYGVVVLSKAFFAKDWPKSELDGLVARQNSEGRKVILPIWHKVSRTEVQQFSPMLAGLVSAKSEDGLGIVVENIMGVVVPPQEIHSQITQSLPPKSFRPTEKVANISSVIDQAIEAVENKQPNQILAVRKFMDGVMAELDTSKPDFSKEGERDDFLVESINQTMQVIINFAQLGKSIAMMNASEPALILYKSFDKILSHYWVPSQYSGVIPEDDFDFYKFIGHEFFVTLISIFITEDRWEIIANILEEEIYIKNIERAQGGIVSFPYISKKVRLLDHRNKRLGLNRVSIHADILKERHSTGELAGIVPFDQFMNADYFLFLRGEFEKPDTNRRTAWNAWSTIFLQEIPFYLLHATRKNYAEKLLRPLGIDTIEKFRSKLLEVKTSDRLAKTFGDPFYFDLDNPIENLNPQNIGTR